MAEYINVVPAAIHPNRWDSPDDSDGYGAFGYAWCGWLQVVPIAFAPASTAASSAS